MSVTALAASQQGAVPAATTSRARLDELRKAKRLDELRSKQAAFKAPAQSSYEEMAATPQKSFAGTAPQWAAEAPIMGGRTIQDEGREALQSASTKLRVKTPGAVETNRHDSADPDLLGGIGDLLKTANFSVRDWWKHSSYKDKENLIASIPIEATGTGAIARLSDHIGQKTGNDFLVDKTGNFKTDASYDPVAELEMYALNAGSWSTRNQLGGVINPRAVTRSTVGPQLPGVRQALASPTLKEVLPHAADVATNMTMGGSDVATAAARGGVNLAKDVGNALRAGPAATPPPAPVTAAAANPSVAQPAPTAVPPTQPGPAPQSAPVAQAPIPQAAPRAAPSVAVQSNLPNGFFQSSAGDGYKHKAGYSPNVGVAIQNNTPSAQTTSYIRKDGGYGDARELNYVDESSLQDVWHPSNDAAKAEAVDLLNRMGGEADNARYKAMRDRLKKVVADDQAGTYAPESPASSAAPVVQPTAPQAPPRPTQPRPASTGQQPNAGNAAPGAGPAPAAAAQPVLNATPAAAQSPIALAKSDAKIIGRLLQAGGVPRNDVNNLLTGLVQAYQGSNNSRLPLAFFAEEYLPTVLPKQTADDVIQKLRGFGRERYSANGPKDTSRSTMRNTVDTLRSTQQDNLSGVMDANLYKGKLIGQEDKLNAQLEQNARTAYTTALENANNRLLNGKATQAERDALGEIQALLHNGAFLKEVPAHLRIKAMRDGINLEDYVQKDPIAAAHWLQSELRQAVTAAEGVGGMATSESRLYGEMRTTLLEQLEKVVPGYRGARKAHGDIYGAKEAIEFGGNFFKSARSEVETARLARQFKAMSVRQKTAATMSIRDALKNEFRNKAEDTAAKVTRLQQAGVLDALETVLGADGKRVADAIRNTVKENERIRAVDMMSGSNTADNLAQMEAAQEAVRSPVNKAIGSLGDNRSWAATLTGDALLAVNGLPPVLTGGKIASSAVGKLGKPSARKLASATKTLYDLPTPGANALASPPRAPRASGPRSPKPSPEQAQATLDDLLRQYDALDHRANPEAGQKLLRQIDRLKKQLGGPTPNALSTPPRPPVKAGFGGSKQPLPMDGGAARDAKGIEFKDGLGGARIGPAEATFIVDGDNIRIPMLRIGNTAERGKGAASRLLDAIIHKADAEGKRIFLTPEPVATGAGLTQRQLEKFYRSRGFVPNKGRSQDFEFRESFVRNPSKRSSSLPMDEASRMGRAREQGFDTGRVAYRGLGRAYDESGKGGGRRYQMFTSSESDAAEYGSNVVSAYLRKGNNLQLDGGGRNFNSVSVSQLPDDVRAKLHPSIQGVARIDDIADAAQKAGYDSVTVANVFDNAWGEVPTKQRPRTQKDIDLDNDLLRELGIDPADTPSAPRAPSPPKKNTDPVTIDVVFDTKNIRSADATFDPAESGSSKLLAGMGAAPEGVGAAAGGIGGGIYGATAPLEDANKDGVIDASDRQAMIAQYGLGGVVSGGLAVKGARMGGGAFGNALKRSSAPPALETSGPPKIVRPELKLTERVDTPKRASAPATPGKTAVPLNRPITIISGKSDTGKGYTVTAEAFNDRGRMVLSPEWPTNAFDELEKARQKAAMDSAFPPKPGPKLVDENYGKPPKPRSEWEVENPKAAEEIGRKVAERFVGLMNADPSPVHVLALKEGVDIQSIGNIIEGGLPKNRQIWIAKDGGEIAVVDKAWHRQNPQEYTTERWNRMWPSSVTREGRRYGWQEGRPFIFADEAPNPPPAQAGFSFGGGKGPPQPQANALASPPKKPRPVEARREAPRGNKPFNNPSLSQGENKISEMLLNGYEYPAIADEMMTSVDVVKQLAKRAQDKLGDAVKLPRPGMGKRPVGSTKREAAFGLFDEGLDNATIAQRTGLSLGNVRTYRSYWKQESGAPVANVNGASYNPPEMPPRPFEADYPQKDWPNGPPVDAQGRLVFDMEGRPLNQNATIVGRSKAPGVGSQSEADRPLRDKTATIQTLRNTGSEFERTPRENLPGQTDGYWNPSYADNGRFTGRGSAVIADDLDRPVMGLDDQELMTIAHELAHNIDFKTNPARSVDDYNARKWGIDPADSPGKAKVNDQLLRIYRDLNNAPGAEAKIGRPLDRGYQQAEEARELWAEAIRAYMWDPNYIKTVAPDVAFMIRHHVNRNSSLRKTIQFNAIPTIVGVGGLGLGAAALNGQPAEAKTRSSGMRANALAPAQNNRP